MKARRLRGVSTHCPPLELGLAGAWRGWAMSGARGGHGWDLDRRGGSPRHGEATSCRWRAATIGVAGRLLDCVGSKAVEDGGGGTETAPTSLWHKI
jgi:hypothetical protein